MNKLYRKLLDWNVKNLDGGNPSKVWIILLILVSPIIAIYQVLKSFSRS